MFPIKSAPGPYIYHYWWISLVTNSINIFLFQDFKTVIFLQFWSRVLRHRLLLYALDVLFVSLDAWNKGHMSVEHEFAEIIGLLICHCFQHSSLPQQWMKVQNNEVFRTQNNKTKKIKLNLESIKGLPAVMSYHVCAICLHYISHASLDWSSSPSSLFCVSKIFMGELPSTWNIEEDPCVVHSLNPHLLYRGRGEGGVFKIFEKFRFFQKMGGVDKIRKVILKKGVQC